MLHFSGNNEPLSQPAKGMLLGNSIEPFQCYSFLHLPLQHLVSSLDKSCFNMTSIHPVELTPRSHPRFSLFGKRHCKGAVQFHVPLFISSFVLWSLTFILTSVRFHTQTHSLLLAIFAFALPRVLLAQQRCTFTLQPAAGTFPVASLTPYLYSKGFRRDHITQKYLKTQNYGL